MLGRRWRWNPWSGVHLLLLLILRGLQAGAGFVHPVLGDPLAPPRYLPLWSQYRHRYWKISQDRHGRRIAGNRSIRGIRAAALAPLTATSLPATFLASFLAISQRLVRLLRRRHSPVDNHFLGKFNRSTLIDVLTNNRFTMRKAVTGRVLNAPYPARWRPLDFAPHHAVDVDVNHGIGEAFDFDRAVPAFVSL